MGQLLKRLTVHRLFNLFVLGVSFFISRITKKLYFRGHPMSLSVEPVNFCNLHCPECPVGNGLSGNRKDILPVSFYEQLLEDRKDTLLYLILYFQGEPLLHKQFVELVRIAKQKGVYTHTSTNAQLLTNELARELVASGLDKLIVSVDGTTQEVYESYRIGGQLQKAIDGIKYVADWKKKLKSQSPEIELQFIVLKNNEHQIPNIKALGKKWGADKVVLKTAQLYDFENGHDLMPSQPYSRYKKKPDGSYGLKKKISNRCWRQWSGAVVTADGFLLPCCFDKQGEHAFGNLNEQAFSVLWKGDKAMKFRQQLLSNRSAMEICRNCSE